MATTTTKGRADSQSLTRSRSLGRKPKPPGSSEQHNSNSDGSDHKPEKPLPNYLKPTISSRPDPVKQLKKGHNGLDDQQKLLRRRSFDRPPSSLMSSPSTSSPRLQKSLNISPARPRDRPSVPREKPVTGLRSSSFQGSKSSPRGGSAVKSSPMAPKGSHGTKKSGLSTSSSSLHSKKEGSSVNVSKKSSDKEIIRESSPPTPVHEEEEEIVKVETDVQVSDDREEPKSEDKEVQAEVVQCKESSEEKESDQTDASPVLDCPDVTKEEEEEEEEEEEVINEDKTVEPLEEAKAPEDNLDEKCEGEDEVKMKVDEESSDAVATDVKEAASVKESTEEEKAGDKEQEKETESSSIKEGTSETKPAVAESPEVTKRQVVQGKKESPSAYNDVIEKTASKLLENRKNKVKALVGAFETVIDYETAASK